MSIQTQEARIILAIEAIQTSKKLSRRAAAKIYKVPYTTLSDRIDGRTFRPETRPVISKLTKIEEEVIIPHILDMEIRWFAPRLAGVEDMANYILESRGGQLVRKLWAHRFVQRALTKHALVLRTAIDPPIAVSGPPAGGVVNPFTSFQASCN